MKRNLILIAGSIFLTGCNTANPLAPVSPGSPRFSLETTPTGPITETGQGGKPLCFPAEETKASFAISQHMPQEAMARACELR